MNIKVNEIPIKSGIYKFTNIDSGKIYIGSAKNLRKRFVLHLSNLRLNIHHSKHFQNAWNKYGEAKFEYAIVEFVEDVNDLLIREQYYLDTLLFALDYINKKSNQFLELGYNINPSASNKLGSKQSKEAILKSVLNNDRVEPVMQFDFNGNLIAEYYSSGEASRQTNIGRGQIYACCIGKNSYCHDYIFIYKKDYESQKDYLLSLKQSPFIKQVWNKGKTGLFKKSGNNYIVFDRYGRFVDIFPSQKEISLTIGATTANVSKAKNKKLCKNHYIFDINYNYSEMIDNIKNEYEYLWDMDKHSGNIMVYTIFNEFITSFENLKECCKIMNLNECTVRDNLTGRAKQCKGFIIKYNQDIV